MSNQSSACADAQTMSAAVRKPGRSFWRTFLDAWVKAHAARVDPNGNVMFQL
jgi:hypothetical protein